MHLFAFAVAFAQDTTAPVNPSILINGGDTYTNSASVSLTLSAEDDTGVIGMCISSSATSCTSWVGYTSPYTYSLGTTPQGSRTVYVRFRDAASNTSTVASDTIFLDSTAPTAGLVTATSPNSGRLDLSWGEFTEAGSGIASYIVVYSTSGLPAGRCTSGTVAYSGTGTSATLTGLSDGSTYYIRACAVDNAGNTSTGTTTTGVPQSESNPPSGTVIINSGDAYSSSTGVTVTLAATDDTAVTQMCLSTSTTCTAWQTYTTTRSWTFSGNGAHTLYAWFKDNSGNVSSMSSDAIVVDTARPTNGTVSTVSGDGSIALSWSGFTDSTSGIASYKVAYSTSSLSNCSGGTLAWTGTDTALTLSSLSNGTTYNIRVCATDNAGNTSTGALVSVKPASELDPPTGSVTIAGGAAWTNSSTVALGLSATDASGLARMCVSNTTTCTSWTSFEPSRTWTLAASGALRTVYAWFEDTNGNRTTSPVSDSVNVDTVKPTNGTVSGSADTVSVDLGWSGFSDAASGVASYVVAYTRSASPPSTCSIGTVAYAGTATSATVSGLLDDTTYAFRVCAVDTAGNVSTGATVTLTTAVDATAPTGTVVLNSGAAWANSATVSVGLDATDDLSGVNAYCFSEGGIVCTTAWADYAPTTTWTLPETEGTHHLYVWFQDGAFNRGGPFEDSIGLDFTSPTDGTLSASFTAPTTATLSWSGFADALSGVAGYRVAYNLDGSDPVACTNGELQTSVSGTSTTLTGLSDVILYTFRVCAIDAAGNVSAGATDDASWCPVVVWYADDDGDGFGDSDRFVNDCTPPDGYVEDGTDCNDSSAAIRPGVTEVCDSIDNDCDGATDDADPGLDASTGTAWYADDDGDGFGDPTAIVWACLLPADASADATDCDDTDAEISPAAEDFVCDGIDNDCDGDADPDVWVALDFDSTISASVLDLNSAASQQWSGSDGYLRLTPASNAQVGTAWLVERLPVDVWYATFTFSIGGGSGSGADGMTFSFLDTTSTSAFGGTGGYLGVRGLAGYTVEFDTFTNSGDPSENHVAIANASNLSAYAYSTAVPEMENTGEHAAEVWFDNGYIEVYVDGTRYIATTITGWSQADAMFGFTAATGGQNNIHSVDDFVIGCP